MKPGTNVIGKNGTGYAGMRGVILETFKARGDMQRNGGRSLMEYAKVQWAKPWEKYGQVIPLHCLESDSQGKV